MGRWPFEGPDKGVRLRRTVKDFHKVGNLGELVQIVGPICNPSANNRVDYLLGSGTIVSAPDVQ